MRRADFCQFCFLKTHDTTTNVYFLHSFASFLYNAIEPDFTAAILECVFQAILTRNVYAVDEKIHRLIDFVGMEKSV